MRMKARLEPSTSAIAQSLRGAYRGFAASTLKATPHGLKGAPSASVKFASRVFRRGASMKWTASAMADRHFLTPSEAGRRRRRARRLGRGAAADVARARLREVGTPFTTLPRPPLVQCWRGSIIFCCCAGIAVEVAPLPPQLDDPRPTRVDRRMLGRRLLSWNAGTSHTAGDLHIPPPRVILAPHAVDAARIHRSLLRAPPAKRSRRALVLLLPLRRTHIDLNVASEARIDPPIQQDRARSAAPGP